MNAGDNTYLIDDEALCDEFDFLNNMTDNDDSLSSEGTRFVYCGHSLSTTLCLKKRTNFETV